MRNINQGNIIVREDRLNKKEIRKKMLRSTLLAITALFSLIFVSVAWFASNTNVSGSGVNISAQDTQKYFLATAGKRTDGDLNYYKTNDQNVLTENGPFQYTGYYDINDNIDVNNVELNLYTGTAWKLAQEDELQPGARGKLEFYVVPTVDNLMTINLVFEVMGFKNEENRAVLVENNDVLYSLLKGHLLFFKSLDDYNGYSARLNNSSDGTYSFTLSLNDGTTAFEKDKPYKCSIYWVWPRRFRNIIYNEVVSWGDLFSNVNDRNEFFDNVSPEYLYYDGNNLVASHPFGDNYSQINDTHYNTASTNYNLADEYIGENIDFVYFELKGIE